MSLTSVQTQIKSEVSVGTDPTFLIIGAQKAATTWLYRILEKHPDVHIPDVKEVNFFNKTYNYEKGRSWYRRQFEQAGKATAVGDATPNYLWTSSTERDLEQSSRNRDIPKLVHDMYPDIKLIVSLRDPVSRARSAFLHHIRDRTIPPNASILEVGELFGIFSMGYYDTDLAEWFKYFSRDQFLVLVFEEDIIKHKEETVKKVFSFIDVDDSFEPDELEKKYNRTEGDSYIHLHYHFPWVAKVAKKVIPGFQDLNYPKIEVKEHEKEKLRELYTPHIVRLEKLLDRPMPWKKAT